MTMKTKVDVMGTTVTTASKYKKSKAARLLNQVTSKNQPTSGNRPSLPNQALYGWHGYEFMKRAFIDANPDSTASENEQACHRFARLAGV